MTILQHWCRLSLYLEPSNIKVRGKIDGKEPLRSRKRKEKMRIFVAGLGGYGMVSAYLSRR